MPTTTERRVIGQALLVTISGTPLGCWDNIKLDTSIKTTEATCASSPIDQMVTTTKTAKGSFETYLGAEQATVLKVGDEFIMFAIKEGANDVSAILADVNAAGGDFANSKARVTSVSESFGKDAAKATVNFQLGFID